MANVMKGIRIKENLSKEVLAKHETHPCFNAKAHDNARMHLPVAPKCNIQCNYCYRKYDCSNESRPGVTSDVLSPQQALNSYKDAKKKHETLSVVGIAGPGDALANWANTKKTLQLIKEYDPEVTFCLSTNGLKLTKYADELIALGVSHITVTINTVYEDVAAKIYRHIRMKGEKHFGIDAASTLLKKQWEGVEYLKDKDVFVKVNTVYLKGINDDHIEEIVAKAERLGASVTNIMGHIPVKETPFGVLEKPTTLEVYEARQKCNEILPQMMHCNQCRADAVGKLGGCRSAV